MQCMETASTSGISSPRTRARGKDSSFCLRNYCLSWRNEADKVTEKRSIFGVE